MKSKSRLIFMGIVTVFAFMVLCYHLNKPSPIEAYEYFTSNEYLAEDQLMDPLILAGDRVVPILLEHISDPNMPRRRYAIGFLGNGEYHQAIPHLKAILENPVELDYYRWDALEAIAAIESETGKELAKDYLLEEGNLGSIANSIDKNEFKSDKRTYWQALLGAHDN